MKIMPIEIQQKQFKVRFRGFDVMEVDNFLEQLADTFELLKQENKNAQDEIQRIKLESRGYKEREETFKRAMLNSQKVLDQTKENARKSAELIIANAEVKAEKILNGAHIRLAQLHDDIAELKRQRIQIEVQVRSVIEAHTKLLEIGNEGMRATDAEDAKLKLLKHSKASK